jgi:hypothetical protein
LLDIGPKDLGIGGPVDRHDRLDALEAQRAQHHQIRAIVLGNGPTDAGPLWGPAIQARHREIDTGFIHTPQPPEIEPGVTLKVSGAGRLDLIQPQWKPQRSLALQRRRCEGVDRIMEAVIQGTAEGASSS